MNIYRYFSAVALFYCFNTYAYDVTTHGMLTYQAYLQSDLSKQPLLQDLGIEYFLSKESPFGDTPTQA